MDEGAHFGFAYVLFLSEPWLLAAVFFALVPDLLVAPFVLLQLQKKKSWKKLAQSIREPYFYSHSFFLMTVAAAAAWLFVPWLALPLVLGWGFHLFLDLFSHKDSSFGERRPLYPLSGLKVRGLFYWRNKTALAATYSLLAALLAARMVLNLF